MVIPLVIADLLMLAIFAFHFSRIPPQIPIFYSHPWGEAQLADIWMIALIPVLMHLFVMLNTGIVKRFLQNEPVMTVILKTLNWFLVIVCTGIFLKIIFLVT